MSQERLYRLASSTVVEPLVARWSAWSYLISPVPASLHLVNYQMKTIQSYLDDPEAHVKAATDPKFIGGPFIEAPPSRAEEIKSLLEAERKQSARIEFANEITEFQNWLVAQAKGQCLEPYYELITDRLRGYVELVYDYYNRPSVRFIESLLYESEYYDRGLQSLRIWRMERDQTRPFFMSTPRLREPADVEWAMPFDDARVDDLFKLDAAPKPLGFIRELLGLMPADDERLLPMLSQQSAAAPQKWTGPTIRIKYFGHACVLVEWNGISVLTDPFISAVPSQQGISRFTFADLPERIDYALITHNHQDHFALEALLRLRHRIEHLVVPKSYGLLYGDISLKLMAQKLRFKNVIELDSMESIRLPEGEIIAVPFLGEHGDLAHAKTAYVVRARDEQMLFAADSDFLESRIYQNVCKRLGSIRTVFLGTECVGAPLTWVCGSLFPKKPDYRDEQTRRFHGCDSKAAMSLLETVNAERIYNYAMGLEPWIAHLLGLALSYDSPQFKESEKLLAKARGRGMLWAERLFGKREIYIDTTSAKRSFVGIRGKNEHALSLSSAQEGAGMRSHRRHPWSRDEQQCFEDEQECFESDLAYWKQQLANRPPVLRFRSADAKPGPPAYHPSRPSINLSSDLCESLKTLSGQQGHTLFVTLLAAFQSLLYHHTKQEDIIVATARDNRMTAEAESLIGGVSNTLVLRADLSGNPSFVTLLDRVGRVFSRALDHSSVPYESIAQALGDDPHTDGGRLFNAMFYFDYLPMNSSGLSPVEFEIPEFNQSPGDCDITLALLEKGREIVGTVGFNAGVVSEATIGKMTGQFKSLLETVAAQPECLLSDLLRERIPPSAYSNSGKDAEDQFVF
jgi:hypothetical protein